MDKIAKRKPNWSNEEIEVLVQGVTDNIRLIKGKFTPSITNEAKNRCWVEITSHILASRVCILTSRLKSPIIRIFEKLCFLGDCFQDSCIKRKDFNIIMVAVYDRSMFTF
uniref:Myb/SANT-like DNA-binding domain-containing protein n=1 Tax=Magallana gigas TaxID=29159 RepID=A0A8W8MHJ5_MAGGI